MPERALHAVDLETGEIHRSIKACPNCSHLEQQIEGAEKEIRAWRTRYANLAKDKEREARESPYWPFAVRLFSYWKKACNKPRCKFRADRFEAILPHLRDDPLLCIQAIAGAAFDPYLPPPGKNGRRRPKNDWGLIFRSSEKVHDFADRVPKNWKPPKGFEEALEEGWKSPEVRGKL